MIKCLTSRQVKPFVKRFNNHVMDPTVKKAVQQAEEALLLSREERKELVNCLPSDEEDSVEGNEQSMQSDEESPSKEINGLKRKSSDNGPNKDDEDDDDEVTGRKVKVKNFLNGWFQKISIPIPRAATRNSKGEGGLRRLEFQGHGGGGHWTGILKAWGNFQESNFQSSVVKSLQGKLVKSDFSKDDDSLVNTRHIQLNQHAGHTFQWSWSIIKLFPTLYPSIKLKIVNETQVETQSQ